MIAGLIAQSTSTSGGIDGSFLFISFAVGAVLAFIPALIASRKGQSFLLFWLFGFLCWLPAIIVALLLKDNTYKTPYRPIGYQAYGQQPWPPQAQAPAPAPPPTDAPPAGWYPDPGGSGRQRYWDGTRWTEHLS